MVKSPGARLLRSLLRAGKAQQRATSRLARELGKLAQPGSRPKAKAAVKAKAIPQLAPPRSRPAASAAAKAKPKAIANAGTTAPRQRAREDMASLPGKWLAAQYVNLPALGTLSGPVMSYWLYLPASVPDAFATAFDGVAAPKMPLVVMLHGCEQTATQFAQGTRMNRLAEQKGFAVVYPQQSLRSHPHRCWKWYDKATQAGGGDVPSIVGIIGQVLQKYPIDPARIYIGGISAGAGMANIVALNHPELIAAVGLHSGPVFGASHNAIGALGVMQHGASHRADGAIAEILAGSPAFPQMPTILIQGESDRIVRPVNQEHLVRQSLLLNRLPADSAVSVVLKPGGAGSRNPALPHQIRDFSIGRKVLLRVAQIQGLEHAWSGGDASFSFNSKAGPNASRMMFDFFARHRRVG
jgi:poly(hydroxyalkanoate) depolymerase family esterase